MKQLSDTRSGDRRSALGALTTRLSAFGAAVGAPFVVMCVLYAGFAITVPNYLGLLNQQQLMRDFAEPALLAIAMAITVMSGGMDLSIGATFAIANFVALYLFRIHGLPLELVTLGVLGTGLVIGAVNGFLIAFLKTKPFLTTLAVLIILRAGYDWIANENTTELAIAMHDTAGWQFLGRGYVLGIPTNMGVLLVVALAMHILLTRIRPGLHIMAVGASRKAARHAGIHVGRSLFLAYVLSGMIASLAGLFYAARQNSAGSDTGLGLEIAALTAVMVGGISLAGGRGTVARALIGAAITFLLVSGFLRMNLPGPLTSSLSGAILILAMVLAGLWAKFGGLGKGAGGRNASHEAAQSDIAKNAGTEWSTPIDEPMTLQLKGASKAYGGIHALENVDFEARPGEIHALLGENGAGKSTLSKIIAGAVPLTHGALLLNGKLRHFSSPADSIEAGIAMVYQETSLIPTMTVAQNLTLGREKLVARFAAMRASAERLLKTLGFDVDATARAEQLGTARRQMVEIARAVQMNARVMIFDEPTASLTPPEVEHFLHLLESLKKRGVAVIFITHALEEALAVSDRVTILRDGKLVTSGPAEQFDRAALIRHMVGRDVETSPRRKRPEGQTGTEMLRVEDLSYGDIVRGASFSLKAGEVVGIAGLVGSGRTEIAKLISGVFGRRFGGGRVFVKGRQVRYGAPHQAIADGVVYITEDRKIDGFFETMSIDDNIYLAQLASPKGARWFYSKRRSRQTGGEWIGKLSISALDRNAKIIQYSGGNQQKVVVAKALAQGPGVVFFDEPTRGVDVGAIPQIHDIIRDLADSGKAVVVISSYLPEILAASDRILVVRGGQVVEELDGETATQDQIMHAAVS